MSGTWVSHIHSFNQAKGKKPSNSAGQCSSWCWECGEMRNRNSELRSERVAGLTLLWQLELECPEAGMGRCGGRGGGADGMTVATMAERSVGVSGTF